MMTTAIVEDYRLERLAQDARFNARAGAGAVDVSLGDTEEYRAYFGLGEYAGSGVEQRVTFRSYLIARAAERRAEREAAEADRLAALPTHFLLDLAGIPAVDAELERRAAEFVDAPEFLEVVEAPTALEVAVAVVEAEVAEIAAQLVAEVVEILEAAAVAGPVGISRNSHRSPLARVATRMRDCSYNTGRPRGPTMTEIWFTATKTGKRRAYYFSTRAFRSFPLPLAKAELMIATGEAVEIPCNPFSPAAFEAAR